MTNIHNCRLITAAYNADMDGYFTYARTLALTRTRITDHVHMDG